MKSIISKISFAVLLVLVQFGLANGQATIQSDLTITGIGTDMPSGGYPGYNETGHLTFVFASSNTSTGIPLAGAVNIRVDGVAGMQFNAATMTLPTGWSASTAAGGVTLNITNTAPIPAFSTSGWIGQTFTIPFELTQGGFTNNNIQVQPSLTTAAFLAHITYGTSGTPPPTTIAISVMNVPLPVKFASIDAKADGCSIDVNWSTGLEQNSDHFVVERSMDGKSFTQIGQVQPSAQDNAGLRAYSFVDETPAKGTNYYRVAQVSVEKTKTYSQVAHASVNCSQGAIHIFPNPSKGVFYIDGLNKVYTVEAYNVLGQRLMSYQTTEAVRAFVDLTQYADGTYSIRVLDGNQVIYQSNVVKK